MSGSSLRAEGLTFIYLCKAFTIMIFSNSVDPDQMSSNSVFHPDQSCLTQPLIGNAVENETRQTLI